jgi:hypothetical protein
MKRSAWAVIPVGLLGSSIALLFVPRECAACEVSGGPSEAIFLQLESIKKDGSSVPLSERNYPATSVEISGVGPNFALVVMRGDTAIVGSFAK